ncbi:hypothetical protein ACMBCN_00370 [Candidatus Liberibacter asiaticus]
MRVIGNGGFNGKESCVLWYASGERTVNVKVEVKLKLKKKKD